MRSVNGVILLITFCPSSFPSVHSTLFLLHIHSIAPINYICSITPILLFLLQFTCYLFYYKNEWVKMEFPPCIGLWVKHCSYYVHISFNLHEYPYQPGAVSSLDMKTMKHRKVRLFAQYHTARKWRSWELNPSVSVLFLDVGFPKPLPSTTHSTYWLT